MTILRGTSNAKYRWLAALCTTTVCLGLSVGFIDIGAGAAALASANRSLWGLTIVLSIGVGGLRALRVVMLNRSAPAWPLIRASCLHNAANALLPAKMGDVALPIALRRYAGLGLAQGIGLLLVVRLSDLATLAGLGLILLGATNVQNLPDGWRLAMAALGTVLCLGPGAVPIAVKGSRRWITKLRGEKGMQIAAAVAHLEKSSAVGLVILTLAVWLVLGLAACSAVAAVGLHTGWTITFLACIAASFAFASPVNGVASVGPFEAAFAGVLTFGNASATQAVAAAVILHMSSLIAAALTGSVALGSPAARRELA